MQLIRQASISWVWSLCREAISSHMASITEWMGAEDCLLLSGLPWIAFCPVIDPATLARAGARKQLGDQRKTSQPLLHRNMPYQTKPNQTKPNHCLHRRLCPSRQCICPTCAYLWIIPLFKQVEVQSQNDKFDHNSNL